MATRRQVLVMITPLSRMRIDGILDFAQRHGWQLMFQDRLGGLPPSFDYDGILVTLRADRPTLDYVRAARRRGIPVVDLTIQHPRIALPRVISDHAAIGRLAGVHFRERGLTRAAWFSTGWSNVHGLRLKGFADALGFLPDRWVTADTEQLRTFLMRTGRPTGILAYDETDAVRLLNACTSCGLSVPDDIAILSIGDDPLITDHQSVPISCIRQNFPEGGRAAAALLDRLMNGEPPPPRPELVEPGGIVVRRSTDTYADDNPLIARTLRYIRDNLDRPFGAAQIAEALGVSRSRLDKAFVAKFNRSIGDEIFSQRIGKARRLLAECDMNVNEIATACGFCATSYFIRKFTAAFGMTPHQWRKGRGKAAPTDQRARE